MNFQEKQQEYARLIVENGAAIQKGQELVLRCPAECWEFGRMIVKAGYEAGAKEVIVHWGDDEVARLRYEYAEQKKAVNRFMLVLSTLYSLDQNAFAEATESLHGRTRVYFAADEQTLLKNGNQTKPKHVPGTPYWVITNTNTGRKCSMVEHIMQSMQFPAELIEKVCGTI